MTSNSIKTTCPYCGVGCGILATRDQAGRVRIEGDPDHPANKGRLCSKGAALGETLDHDDRLLQPHIGTRATDWESALERVAEGFRSTIQRYGPDSVAFYVSGQLLTEDYYVANKLMKGFIGSGNIDTNSRLCMSSSVAGYKRAFGSDTVPCSYQDIEQADLLLLVGSNAAWCHPVLFQRIRAVKKQRPELQVVVIDPRHTPTCDIADLHLPLKPGSDIALFNGLLHYLERNGKIDWGYIVNHTTGYSEALEAARGDADPVDACAEACDLPHADVLAFFQRYADTTRTLSLYSQGVNQWSYGTDKVNAIINCHLATGRIGHPGMGPFSLTGQPNAMGGREVGGLANQLAAHMDFTPDDVDRVGRFWQAPAPTASGGLKALDMFSAMAQGRIKAVWIMATNPMVSLPDADQARAALQACDLVVVSDCMHRTDTTAHADILLPAATWGEKQGSVTNSERCISRQRSFLPAPGEARADWWIISQVARRMGYPGFEYHTAADIFKEHAALSGFENNGSRDFDISALADLDEQAYADMEPIQWPVTRRNPQGTERLFSDGSFHTPDGRARLIPVAANGPANPADQDYPLRLNTGRVRDHWHTMTRTGKSPRLTGHVAEPYVEIHPEDAVANGIVDEALVKVRSRWGEVIVRARVAEGQLRGSVFIPMHWNDVYASRARIGAVVNPAADPISGQPEFKHTPVKLRPYQTAWYGFALSRHALRPRQATYWSRARRTGMWHYELAGEEAAADWGRGARELLCREGQTAQWSEFFDPAQHRYRAARFADGRLEAIIFIGPDHRLPPRDWLARLFEQPSISDQERARILAGTPGRGAEDRGKVVCSCFGVGRNTLERAIREQGLVTTEALGEALQAGTNCGSCIPELRELIAQLRAPDAA